MKYKDATEILNNIVIDFRMISAREAIDKLLREAGVTRDAIISYVKNVKFYKVDWIETVAIDRETGKEIWRSNQNPFEKRE